MKCMGIKLIDQKHEDLVPQFEYIRKSVEAFNISHRTFKL